MSTIKISVITINYNHREGLSKTISSVINQTYRNIEYILIDGNSTDGSRGEIEKAADKISYWVSEKDKGIYNAMNKGIARATGDYLIFINSGDTLDTPQALEHLVKDCDASFDLIYGDLRLTYPDGRSKVALMPASITMETMINGTLYHPVTLIRRGLFEQYGLYNERLKIVSDWAFFLKIIAFASIKQQHKPVIVANFMMDGVSSDNHVLIEQEKRMVKEELFAPNMLRALDEYGKVVRFYYYPGMNFIRSVIGVFRKVKNSIKGAG